MVWGYHVWDHEPSLREFVWRTCVEYVVVNAGAGKLQDEKACYTGFRGLFYWFLAFDCGILMGKSYYIRLYIRLQLGATCRAVLSTIQDVPTLILFLG